MVYKYEEKAEDEKYKYTCENCNFKTNDKKDYRRHLLTLKHKKISENTEKTEKPKISKIKCNCGKEYTYKSGYYRHKKTCNYKQEIIEEIKEEVKAEAKEGGPDPQAPGCAIRGFASYNLMGYAGYPRTGVPQEVNYKEVILTLINQNKELQDLLIKQQEDFINHQKEQQEETNKKFEKLVLHIKPSNNTVNKTNCNNKTIKNNFNIMMFLNEKCKDAMTIQDFAERLVVSIEDLEKKKFDCLSNTILKNLKSLAITERPVHCGNKKKKEWYVNDKENGWELDNGEKLIKNTEYGINKKFQNEFKKHYPNYSTVENIKDKYMQLINRTFTDLPENEKSRLLNMLSNDLLLEE